MLSATNRFLFSITLLCWCALGTAQVTTVSDAASQTDADPVAASGGSAVSNVSNDSVDADAPQETIDIPIEEIVVIGEMSTASMRAQIRRLDREIQEDLNRWIEDDFYRIECGIQRIRNRRVINFECRPGYVVMARQTAFREASAIDALNDLSVQLFDEPDALILTEDAQRFASASTPNNQLSGNQLNFDVAPLLTDLQQHDREFEELVFEIAKNDPELAEKLVRRYFLELNLEHRKKNWWKNLFGQEVEEIEIPTSIVRLIR